MTSVGALHVLSNASVADGEVDNVAERAVPLVLSCCGRNNLYDRRSLAIVGLNKSQHGMDRIPDTMGRS